MTTLKELIVSANFDAAVNDMASFITTTVEKQSGLTGMALKGALAAATKVDADIVAKGSRRLLPEMADSLDGLWQEYSTSGGSDFGVFYGWEKVDIQQFLPFPISIGTGVAAMAGTEIINAPLNPTPYFEPSTLYFYAREVVSHAWIFNGAVHRPNSGRTPLAFGNSNTLKEASRRGIAARTFAELVSRARTETVAREILNERAHKLADAVISAVDVVDPDSIVFAGEAFTLDPDSLRIVVTRLRESTGSQLRIQRADSHILRTAAIHVALHPIRQDPLAFVAA